MASMPDTPGRGRSRFSKVLPLPPSHHVDLSSTKSPALLTPSTKLNSPLPPAPSPALNRSLLNPPATPRRPLGMTAEQKALSAALARATTSPLSPVTPSLLVMSPIAPTIATATTPSISRTTSEVSSSTMDSSSTLESTPSSPPTPPPRLPTKDQYPSHAKTPEPSTNEGFRLQNQSPPRPEIWKRRSTSASFSELKLEKSNGSTASPPRQKRPIGLPSGPAPISKSLPRSTSGTNTSARKPVPIRRDTPPQTQVKHTSEEQMGNEVTKLKEKSVTSAKKAFQSSSTGPGEVAYSKHNGPPTPEYLDLVDGYHEEPVDVQRKQVLSPRSPDTPPQENVKPRIPPRSDSRTYPVTRKPIQTQATTLPYIECFDNSSSTLKAPEINHKRQSSETLTVTSHTPHPTSASHQALKSISSNEILARASPLTSPTSPLRTPSASKIFFPSWPGPSLSEDTVLPGLPLTTTHLKCYQSHKSMRGSRNLICSVACMVCEKQDKEMRWRCTWCCLSACKDCMRTLTESGRDLEKVLEGMGREVKAGSGRGMERDSGVVVESVA